MILKKQILPFLLGFVLAFSINVNSQNNNRMMELRDSITINTTIAAVSDWFENLDTNFVRWNVRHKEFKYLTGGKAVGDKVYFAQCVEGVWYKVKAVITEKQMDDRQPVQPYREIDNRLGRHYFSGREAARRLGALYAYRELRSPKVVLRQLR